MQTPVWPSQYAVVVMQLVQNVADVQVAQGDVHATQAVPLNQYPAAHDEQVVDATMAVHAMQVVPAMAPPVTAAEGVKPRLHVAQKTAVEKP